MMGERVYSFDAVFAAMCIMEELVDPINGADSPWMDMRENHGISQMRHWVIEELAEACDAAWERADQLHAQAHETYLHRRLECEVRGEPFYEDPPRVGHDSFDYEFVPFWLRTCVDWTGDKPRVRGSAGCGQET